MIKLNEPKSDRVSKIVDASIGMSMLFWVPTLGISLMFGPIQFALGLTVLMAWVGVLFGMGIASKVID